MIPINRINLKAIREAKGMSQVELSRLSGITRSTIIKIERGEETEHSTKTLSCLAQALEIPMPSLFAEVPDPSTQGGEST